MVELNEWFGKRRKEKTMELLKTHVALSRAAMRDLHEMVDGKSDKVEKIKGLEKDADELKRAIFQELARGELNPQDRAYLSDLIKNLDKVTNFIYDTSMFLHLVRPKGAMKEKALDMCKEAERCVALLSRCVDELAARENEKALKTTDEVERSEEAMDQKYAETKQLLLSEKGSPQEILFLYELMLSLERITDVCEDAADTIRMILVKVW